MANSNKENHGSYKGESSLPTVFRPIIPPVDLTLVYANVRVQVQIQHQDRSTLADFTSKEAAEHQPPSIWQSLKKKMVELHQQVMKETIHVERGIPFSEHIIEKELPAQFRALSHLPAYDGTTGLAEYILRSLAEFSSLFEHQFASTKKSRKSTISLFRINQEEKKTLRASIQHFNAAILEVRTVYQEVLLKQEIERFIQASYLKDYVDKEKKREQKKKRSYHHNSRKAEQQDEDPRKENIQRRKPQLDKRGHTTIGTNLISPLFRHGAHQQNVDVFAWMASNHVGVTYQHLVDLMFREEFGRNMEVYVDDMLVKSRQMDQHLAGLTEMFNTLRKYHMKLNPAKCAFGLQSGKFLKYMVTEKGIEVNPKKILAIQEMKPPANLNEVQRLEGCITAPNQQNATYFFQKH
ncbi:Retrovirus-related Pol polyprotein from transposon.6 [Sesamum angolense]|uniref:Retrovirus-related Pol polyprotein from transposon.6 n=1 Tax=Sesamum angolense TaxID=2727404 RepID=A0AAE1X3T1_9LAMI|nr:Retrovirus-related Pol polyprotein from transposon.6 [Sesamum angolense]